MWPINSQDFLEAEKHVVNSLKTKRDRAMVSIKPEYEVIGCLSIAMIIGTA